MLTFGTGILWLSGLSPEGGMYDSADFGNGTGYYPAISYREACCPFQGRAPSASIVLSGSTVQSIRGRPSFRRCSRRSRSSFDSAVLHSPDVSGVAAAVFWVRRHDGSPGNRNYFRIERIRQAFFCGRLGTANPRAVRCTSPAINSAKWGLRGKGRGGVR